MQGIIELRKNLSNGESSHALDALRTSCLEENPGAAEGRSLCRDGSVILPGRKAVGEGSSPGRLFHLGPVVLDGRDFTNVRRGASRTGTSDLRIALAPRAKAILQRYDGGPLAFVVDDQVWGLVDPRALPDELRVDVSSTEGDATQLVRMIKSGALPVKLERLPAIAE
jgi:preprotein translocase subunit SecD